MAQRCGILALALVGIALLLPLYAAAQSGTVSDSLTPADAPQDNNAHQSEEDAESIFIPAPNGAIVSAEPSKKSVWGDTLYNEGVRLYERGQYVEAAAAYKKACDRFAKACTNLGFMYSRGQGVKLNRPVAAEYYQRGCDEGDPIGCTNLGILYRNRALSKSDGGAIELFERGCRNGDSRACRELGYMFAHGDGVQKDENRAAEHYKLADELSHVHRIPIHVEDGLILVSLTIQDADALLIVDTGSSRTTLIAKYLPPGQDLKPTQMVETLVGTGQVHTVEVNWKLDDREIQLPALVGDFTFPHGAVGILGTDLLGMFKSVHFDYSNLVLILKD
jgi:TPR repeat protein